MAWLERVTVAVALVTLCAGMLMLALISGMGLFIVCHQMLEQFGL